MKKIIIIVMSLSLLSCGKVINAFGKYSSVCRGTSLDDRRFHSTYIVDQDHPKGYYIGAIDLEKNTIILDKNNKLGEPFSEIGILERQQDPSKLTLYATKLGQISLDRVKIDTGNFFTTWQNIPTLSPTVLPTYFCQIVYNNGSGSSNSAKSVDTTTTTTTTTTDNNPKETLTPEGQFCSDVVSLLSAFKVLQPRTATNDVMLAMFYAVLSTGKKPIADQSAQKAKQLFQGIDKLVASNTLTPTNLINLFDPDDLENKAPLSSDRVTYFKDRYQQNLNGQLELDKVCK